MAIFLFMKNLISPQLDIPVFELEKIFFNAYSKDTSGDPIGRTNYGIRDRYHCGPAAWVVHDLVEWAEVMYQKIYVIDASQQLAECLERVSPKRKTKLKHYKNILQTGQEIDFTKNQLAYWWEIRKGDSQIYIDINLEETYSPFREEKTANDFIKKYVLLKTNVIQEIAYLFACSKKDIEDYLKTQKFTLLF